MKKIAVIGGGVAGLTAAYFLKKMGHDVCVFEASSRVGGRMTTDKVEDCLIDRGAQFLSSAYSTLMPLIKEVGLTDELKEVFPGVAFVRNKKLRKISANNMLSPLLSGYLSVKEAFSFLKKATAWKSKINLLPLDDYAAWFNFDEEYANTFLLKEFGEVPLEYIFEPQMQGFHYQSPEAVSKIHPLMLLSFMFKKQKVLVFRNGMQTLPEKLASYFPVYLNCPVMSLQYGSSNNVAIETAQGKFFADKVVLAVPATIAKKLFRKTNEIESKLLQAQYGKTINIALASENNWKLPSHLKNIYGILIPRRERECIAGIGIESNKSKERISEGELFDIMLDGVQGERYLSATDDVILKAILPELEKYFPGLSNAIRLVHITRWEAAEPISYIGKSKLIKTYSENLDTSSHIILAGDYMGFPYTDGAAFTGKWAAEFIHAQKCSVPL